MNSFFLLTFTIFLLIGLASTQTTQESTCQGSWSEWSASSGCSADCGRCGKPVTDVRTCQPNSDCPEIRCQGDSTKLDNSGTCDESANSKGCYAPKPTCCEGYHSSIDKSTQKPRVICLVGAETRVLIKAGHKSGGHQKGGNVKHRWG
uniref:Venom protein n=1 Tax=Rhabditophanes sp. KR3021 TaxID=114890 RepID=A0AC35TWP6_9BILA